MPNPETGALPGPEGFVVAGSRQDVTPEAARLFREQVAARRFRFATLSERDGAFTVYHAEVPGAWLRGLLFEWEDGIAGEGETLIATATVE